MTTTTYFENHFWNNQLGVHDGFDKVALRMNKANSAFTQIVDALKTRIKIEEGYVKKLSNLAITQAHGVQLSGTVGKSWIALCDSWEKTSSAHRQLAEALKQHVDSLTEHFEPIKNERNAVEQNVRKLHNELKSGIQRVNTNKQIYHKKCDELLALHKTAKLLKNDPVKQKDAEKNMKKMQQVSKLVEETNGQYRNSIDVLENSRNSWIGTTERALKIFHNSEIERLKFLRAFMWRLTNIQSATCVNIDQSQEEVRDMLLNCGVSKDLHDFVKNNTTGKIKPEALSYQEHAKEQKVMELVANKSKTLETNLDSTISSAATNSSTSNSSNPLRILMVKAGFRSQPESSANEAITSHKSREDVNNQRYSIPNAEPQYSNPDINFSPAEDMNLNLVSPETKKSPPEYASITPKSQRHGNDDENELTKF